MTSATSQEAVQATVLDPAALAALRDIDRSGAASLVVKVVRAFESNLSKQVPQLRLALSEQHRKGVRDAAHFLKSSSAYLGALELSTLCSIAEREAVVADWDRLRRLVDDIAAQVEPALRAVRALPELGAS